MALLYQARLMQTNLARPVYGLSPLNRGADPCRCRLVTFRFQGAATERMALKSLTPPLPQALRRDSASPQKWAPSMIIRNSGREAETSKGSISKARDGLFPRKNISCNGIFVILLVNLGVFVADHLLKLPAVQMLYLYHDVPRWYQFVTSTFCHLSWNHLSSNLFFLYIFGKLVEEEGGSFALWLSYIVTGVGANLVSWLILPRSVVSAGASGAVFGLFAVSVLVKISFDWRKILEVLILGQFVVDKVMSAALSSAQLGGQAYNSSMNINHIAHLSGALVGVALIWALRCLPSGDPKKN